MYSPATSPAAKVYQQFGTQTEIEDASPHRLIQLMMEHALMKISRARGLLAEGKIAAKGENIGAAIGMFRNEISINQPQASGLARGALTPGAEFLSPAGASAPCARRAGRCSASARWGSAARRP